MTTKNYNMKNNFNLKALLNLRSKGYKFCIDTRTLGFEGDIFIALKGLRDGHDFVLNAFEKGAKYCIVKNDFNLTDLTTDKDLITKLEPKLIYTESQDTLESITEIAKQKANYLKQNNAKIISVTGSFGKTTVKNLIYFLLNKSGIKEEQIYKTYKNYNNHIGVPLTLFNCENDIKYLVCEIGMDHSGEIEHLARILKPDVAVITSIAEVHFVNFTNIEQIAKAKGECIKHSSVTVLNKESRCINVLLEEALAVKKPTSIATINDITDYEYKKDTLTFTLYNKYKFIINKFLTKEYLINLSLASKAIESCGVSLSFLHNANLDEFFNSDDMIGRGREIKTKQVTIIDEVYNCSLESLTNAIKNLASKNGSKLAIIGDMLELGTVSRQKHEAIFDILQMENINNVVMIGKEMIFLYNKFLQITTLDSKIDIYYYANLSCFLKQHLHNAKLVGFKKDYDYILLKASNSMGFDKIIKALVNC